MNGYEEELKKVLNGTALSVSLKQRVIIFLTELKEINDLPVVVDVLTEECFPEITKIIGKELHKKGIRNGDVLPGL